MPPPPPEEVVEEEVDEDDDVETVVSVLLVLPLLLLEVVSLQDFEELLHLLPLLLPPLPIFVQLILPAQLGW